MSDSAPPAAGWYADPENPAGERWWNGSGWSDHKRASTVAETPPPPVAPAASGFAFGSGFASTADGRPDPYAVPTPPSYGAPGVTPYSASPYAPSPYNPAPYGAPGYGSGTNGLALAGLIVSAAGWLVLGGIASIAGIILSAFGLAQARTREAAGNPNTGRAMAMAGLVIGIVVTAIGIILVVAYVGLMMSLTTSGYY